MMNLKSAVDKTKRELERMKQQLKALLETNSVSVDDDLQHDLSSIVEKNTSYVYEQHPPDRFQRLFWEQQAAAMKVKDRRQIRWHPMFIKWCLSLKSISSASYRMLRSSNVIILPSDRTLRDHAFY